MVNCPDCGAPAYPNNDKKWYCTNSHCPLITFHRNAGNGLRRITKKIYEAIPRVIVKQTITL